MKGAGFRNSIQPLAEFESPAPASWLFAGPLPSGGNATGFCVMKAFVHRASFVAMEDSYETVTFSGFGTCATRCIFCGINWDVNRQSDIQLTSDSYVADGCSGKLRALADRTRWRMLHLLAHADDPLTPSQLVSALGVSDYNVSKHLRTLRETGLISMERVGKFVHCRLAEGFVARNGDAGRKVLELDCCTIDLR